MRNLVLLIAMVAAGVAGWWAGSWKGRDAIAALEKAKTIGEQVQTAHAQETAALKSRLEAIGAEFAQQQKAREEQFAGARQALETALSGRERTLLALRSSSAGKALQLAEVQKAAEAPGRSAEERAAMQAEIVRLKTELDAERLRAAGLECTKVAVPEELLTPLRVGG